MLTEFRGGEPSNDQSTQQTPQQQLASRIAGGEEMAPPSQSQLQANPAEQRSEVPQEDSQIWRQAIRKYYSELEKGGIKGPALDKDLWNINTPMDLINQIKALESSQSLVSRSWFGSLKLSSRLETVLLSLNDFARSDSLGPGNERQGCYTRVGINQTNFEACSTCTTRGPGHAREASSDSSKILQV